MPETLPHGSFAHADLLAQTVAAFMPAMCTIEAREMRNVVAQNG
jgi:hypothetical protein